MAQVQIIMADSPVTRAQKVNLMLAELLGRPLTSREKIPPIRSSSSVLIKIIRVVNSILDGQRTGPLIAVITQPAVMVPQLNILFRMAYLKFTPRRAKALELLANHSFAAG
jgi:hypothetical protein